MSNAIGWALIGFSFLGLVALGVHHFGRAMRIKDYLTSVLAALLIMAGVGMVCGSVFVAVHFAVKYW